jgi:hypothetical protein
MKRIIFSFSLVLLSFATSQAYAVWDMTKEALVAGVDQTVLVCTPTDPEGVKRGLKAFDNVFTEQDKKDFPAMRASSEYKEVYAKTLERLQSLSSKERLDACRRAW